MTKGIIVFLFTILSVNIYSTTFKVGPGKTYTELGSVPWVTLTAGDTVLIYWK